ncbi:UDP-2,3-diacylglucosamine diphosphatase [Tahibacter amnicola]|uniref:UDP-2,3-diacylglucosamine hydrolase n=1 Tax=Tahibacter amnicola TaxID=2976241 RepID=A0ABY6BBM1_9GAMM|nr:UDP-2,3-diacylglucosamine diphosphatase [Tahibacter amnicola]MCU7375999.1 UDP-2,3-diacylglucosamine diphosphatase [Paucibacter sp. O1-1]MDA3831011.1 UDP-2,3-diacylglucosamine diphosphatase [Paucibacter sp. O1-1]UXI66946.1 UDP-2,3-diacylglucosamine diphosphatase [Tahibacter amnicola]
MPTHFISDLHLQDSRPDLTEIFFRYLRGPARDSEGLYILGDLFETWVGDDDDAPLAQDARGHLRELTATGVPCWFMHGNRDFLVGKTFSEATGVQVLDDPTVVNLYNQPTLLLHGDSLCTDDQPYQAIRSQLRSAVWQAQFLAQPLPARRAFAEAARAKSREHTAMAGEAIMDVTESAVCDVAQAHGIRRIIHGHTHRPAQHWHDATNGRVERWVIADWRDTGEVLLVSADGISRQVLR